MDTLGVLTISILSLSFNDHILIIILISLKDLLQLIANNHFIVFVLIKLIKTICFLNEILYHNSLFLLNKLWT